MENINFFDEDNAFLDSLKFLKEKFSGAKTVAVKLRVGEPGNPNFLKAEFVKRINSEGDS